MKTGTAFASIVAAVLTAGLITLAASQGSLTYGGLPVFALCVALAFGIQWIAFVPAFALQTEHFFDLTGSLTYLALVGSALSLGNRDPRSMLLAGLVTVWAVRLGLFLFLRIRRAGSDRRFKNIKPHFPTFFMTWTLQGLWVTFTLSCGLAAMTSENVSPLGPIAALGVLLWLVGFSFELVADRQKSEFRSRPENAERFIKSGLWAWSRHPNYFGEIVLWAGIAVLAIPALEGWQLATLVSPFFVWFLLTRISGVPMLEERAEKKWGEDPEFRAYRSRTPALFPRKPRV